MFDRKGDGGGGRSWFKGVVVGGVSEKKVVVGKGEWKGG